MNNNIVHENNYLAFSDHLGEHFIHVPLERGGSISLSKEHNEGFENALWSDKRCFPFVSSLDSDIGKSPAHIKLGEVR